MIKKEIRVLGVACASPHRNEAISTQVVAVVYRGNRWLEGVIRAIMPREATSLTRRIIEMTVKSSHYPQLRVIVLDELIAKSGSYIDIRALHKKTRLPVVAALSRKIPIKRLQESRMGHRRVVRTFSDLPYAKWRYAGKTFFIYFAGLSGVDLNELLEVCASREGVPEAARIARITCSSLEKLLIGREPQRDDLNPPAVHVFL
jgi:endonuclease V-like protein UPF0215 family